jgi:hypothetical protein
MKKRIILRKRVNQYRTMETSFFMFPDHLNVRELEYIGHKQGLRTIFEKNVDLFNFDTISFVTESINKISKGTFIHCIGHRLKEDSLTILVFRKKECKKS